MIAQRNQPHLPSPQVVVVEASAGSGKTYALAKRYLQLLMNSQLNGQRISPRNILAITFTNRATLEMKERILEFLKKIALDKFATQEEEEEILSALGVDKKFAQNKSLILMEEIVKHYTFFQVQTIDSFINALLLASSLSIDRSANFRIKRDYRRYLAYSFDRLVDEATSDKTLLAFFGNFLEHYLFVENRSSWFPKEDILEIMHALFTLSNTYGGTFAVYRGESKDLIKKKAFLFSAIKELFSELPEGINRTFKNALLNFVAAENRIFALKKLPDCLRKGKVPMRKGSRAPQKLSRKWQKIHQATIELAELDAAVTFSPYIKLFQKMLGFLQERSRKDDLLFLEELNHKARSLFSRGHLSVAELYYRLAARFNHYLIDEFQDTSILQWGNLEAMIEEALSSGGSLFYVGDKKQAIYRFRGGEAQLFDQVKEKFARYNLKENILGKNWRSQKAIVEFNNEVFSQSNLKRALAVMGIEKEVTDAGEGIPRILKVFKDAKQEYRPSHLYGYVGVERFEGKDKEERSCLIKERLLSLLGRLAERFSYKEIAILCHDNSEVELATSWLLEARIPVASEKTLNLRESPLIKEITCLLRFLDSPVDDLNFASFILGRVFQQAAGFSSAEVTSFLFRRYKDKGKKSPLSLYHLFRNKYPQIWQKYFEDFFKSAGFISPYELTLSIYQRYRVIENFPEEQAFLMKLLELILKQEDECVGLAEFLEYLAYASREDLYANLTESDSVHILTIHKAKGLEFGVVITPFLRIEIVPQVGKSAVAYITNPDKETLGLLQITKEHRKFSPLLNKIYKEAYLRGCIDQLNNTYVAFTRPKYELYIFLASKSGANPNKARCLIPESFKEQGEKRKYQAREGKGLRRIIGISPSRHGNWIELIKNEFVEPDTVKNREKIIEGSLIHFTLAHLGNLYQRKKEDAIASAVKNLKARYPFILDYSPIEEKVAALLSRAELAPFFYLADGRIYCEKEVFAASGELKRIDRLIIKKEEAWVIDFKSSHEKEAESGLQVREYMRIIKNIHPKLRIKGFLIYLDDLSLKELAPVKGN